MLQRTTRLATLYLSALLALVLSPLAARSQPSPALAQADATLVSALAAGDAAALAPHLAEELWWTDAAGRSLRNGAVSEHLPSPLIRDLGTADTNWHVYGQVAVAQSHAGRDHVLRVWIERVPASWKLLAYQEVRSRDTPPTVTPGTGGDCENPCRKVGIDPENATQAAVILAYQELEIAAESRNADLFSKRVADEFVAASSNSDRLFDKPTRIAGFKQNTMRGLSPTALTSGRIYDFGAVAVMVSEHVSSGGQKLHVTRVWIERGAHWVEALSYQTALAEPQ